MERFFIVDRDLNRTYYLVGIKNARPNKNVTITEYPVPEGGKIADHAYLEPKSLSINIISDSLDVIRKSYYIGEDGSPVTISSKDFKDILDGWYRNHSRLTIQTMQDRFENMRLEGISWSEDNNNWTNFSPTINFKEVKTATVYTTTVAALDLSARANYMYERSTGTNNGVAVGSGKSAASVAGGILADAAVGAGIGAVIGSVVPVIGTGVGAIIGGVGGAVVGFFKHLG